MVDREVHARGLFGTYRDAVLPGVHVIEGGQTSTGSIVNWMSRRAAGLPLLPSALARSD
jgi:ribulose kinase